MWALWSGNGRDVQSFLTAIAVLDLWEKLIVRLGIWEGMRPGEILALKHSDVDGASVWVRRRLYRGDVDSPKTRRSSRQVALTRATADMLKNWVEATSPGDSEA